MVALAWRTPALSPRMKFAYSVTDLPLLEFIEPTGSVGSSVSKPLREHGERVVHVGYLVDNISELLERAAQFGGDGRGPGAGIAYLDLAGAHGLRIELVSSDLRVQCFTRCEPENGLCSCCS